MDEMLFGVYRAIVTDISCFEQTGKIKTRITAFNSGSVPRDLISGYDSTSFSDVRSRDILTDIMLPFGGGSDYGMFKLPQVNSVGLVAFIDGSKSFPIWIGSTANSIINNQNNIIHSDLPSDKDNNYPGIYNDDSDKVVFNYDDPNAFIIKTKVNKLDDLMHPETMRWEDNPVENSFILSSTKARIYHRIDDITCQEFILNNDPENNTGSIGLSYYISEEDYRKIEADNNQILVKNKTGDITAQIIIDDKGDILINSFEENSGNKQTGSKIETSIKLTPASVNINAGNSNITMNRNIDENQEKITISAKKIQIISQDISLGSSGYSLVVSPNPGLNFTLQDGSMLTTANNIRV